MVIMLKIYSIVYSPNWAMSKSMSDANTIRKQLADLAYLNEFGGLGPMARVAVHEALLKKSFELQEALQ